MSRKALRQAIIAQLKDTVGNGGLGLTRRECGSAPMNGMPPASAGERYVGVWIGARGTQRVSHGLYEVYQAIVTISYRIAGVYPHDRLGDLLDDSNIGFDDFVDSVRLNIHTDCYDGRIQSRANAIINSSGGPFVTGIEFMSDEEPQTVGGSWWWGPEGDHPAGLVQRLRFGNCARVQEFNSNQGVT